LENLLKDNINYYLALTGQTSQCISSLPDHHRMVLLGQDKDLIWQNFHRCFFKWCPFCSFFN